jgi:hypothetical protein
MERKINSYLQRKKAFKPYFRGSGNYSYSMETDPTEGVYLRNQNSVISTNPVNLDLPFPFLWAFHSQFCGRFIPNIVIVSFPFL